MTGLLKGFNCPLQLTGYLWSRPEQMHKGQTTFHNMTVRVRSNLNKVCFCFKSRLERLPLFPKVPAKTGVLKSSEVLSLSPPLSK